MDILTETDTMDEVNRLEAEQCGSTSVQLVQLPTHSDTPGVSMMSNTGAVRQTGESERCSSTSIQLVQLPTPSEDQYRPMTPGEEEIMRIYILVFEVAVLRELEDSGSLEESHLYWSLP